MDRPTRLNVAIFGAGKMGRMRARACEALGARVRYVHDRDAGAARRLASELTRVPDVASQPSELDWRELDAVFVCTPPSEREPALLAARNRVALFVEKPLALSIEHSMPLLNLLREQPVLAAVGYMNRYRESVLRAKQRVAEGDLIGVVSHWVGKPYAVEWWSRPEHSGGPVNEQATHLIDLVRHVTGREILDVQGFAADPGDLQTYGFLMRLTDGAVCTLLYSSAASDKSIALELFTRQGPISLRGWDFQLNDSVRSSTGNEDKQRIFTHEVACFFRALVDGNPTTVLSTVSDAAKTQAAVDALRKAAVSGRIERVSTGASLPAVIEEHHAE
jgi:myo-inositol 2-dehydrogenase / D-chiro-inositol 1-dehydrogenase